MSADRKRDGIIGKKVHDGGPHQDGAKKTRSAEPLKYAIYAIPTRGVRWLRPSSLGE